MIACMFYCSNSKHPFPILCKKKKIIDRYFAQLQADSDQCHFKKLPLSLLLSEFLITLW